MSDKSDEKPPVEVIPSYQGDVSAIASAHAPFLYFDAAPTFGFNEGVVNITLDVRRNMPSGTTVVWDRVVIAHLRMTVSGAHSLLGALNGALLLASDAAGSPEKPN